MALINFNDTIPAAPAGKTNIKWQADALAPRNVSGYVDSPPAAVSEAPAGPIDGSNRSFSLSFAPGPIASLLLALNGLAQYAGSDFTISAETITYTIAPKTGDIHNAWYTHS